MIDTNLIEYSTNDKIEESKLELKNSQRPIRLAILSCLKASEVCSGSACFRALNTRTASFNVYKEKDIEVIAFFHCNGCGCNYETDADYSEKMDTLIKLNPDVVHIGKCSLSNLKECPVITMMAEKLENNGILIKRGTH